MLSFNWFAPNPRKSNVVEVFGKHFANSISNKLKFLPTCQELLEVQASLDRLINTHKWTTWMKEDSNFFKDASLSVLFLGMSLDFGIPQRKHFFICLLRCPRYFSVAVCYGCGI